MNLRKFLSIIGILLVGFSGALGVISGGYECDESRHVAGAEYRIFIKNESTTTQALGVKVLGRGDDFLLIVDEGQFEKAKELVMGAELTNIFHGATGVTSMVFSDENGTEKHVRYCTSSCLCNEQYPNTAAYIEITYKDR